MTTREQQAQQTYTHIMDTAEKLLENATYETLSVNEICEKAGISKGGFYHHFSSKDQLIALLIGRQMEQYIHKQVAPLIRKKDAFFLLELYICTALEYLKNSPKSTLARCWLAISEHSELIAQRFSQLYFKILYDIISQGIEEGTFRTDITLEFCESFITSVFTGIMLHTLTYENETSMETFVKQSILLLRETLSKT